MTMRVPGSPAISRRTMLKGVALASGLLLLERYLPAVVAHPRAAGPSTVPDDLRRAYAAIGNQTVFAQHSFVIAPGATLTTTTRVTPTGWFEDVVVVVDLNHPAIHLDLITTGMVAASGSVTDMARASGAVAAINADFFDQDSTDAPIGALIQNGSLLKSVQGNPTTWNHIAIGTDRIGRLLDIALVATFSSPRFADPQPLTYLNVAYQGVNNSIGLYTPVWSTTSEPIQAPDVPLMRWVEVADGSVSAVSTATVANQRVTIPAPPANGFLLLGRDAGAELLGRFELGDQVSYSAAAQLTPAITPQMLVGGNIVLVADGAIPGGLDDVALAARSAIGFSGDGTRVYLTAIDGAQVQSRGLTILELGQFMRALGAATALNLDGGGSTQLVVRRPGALEAGLINRPSDRSERGVPVAIGLFAAAGDGTPADIVLAPALDDARAVRVFSGLQRSFYATGRDNALAPTALGPVTWTVAPTTALQDLGGRPTTTMTRAFRGGEPGTATLTVTAGAIAATLDVKVLGAPARIATNPARAVLADATATLRFEVIAFDAGEHRAPVEVSDVTVDVDPAIATISGDAGGTHFLITPTTAFGATLATIRVGTLSAVLAITIGTEKVVVADLSYADQSALDAAWSTESVRAGGTLAVAAGRTAGKNGVRISFDFSGTCAGCSTGTRATYLRTRTIDPLVGPERLALPGQPLAIGAWVKADDGFLPWMRCQVYDTAGAVYQVDFTEGFREAVGSDWFFIEAQVPAGVSYPLYFRHLYPVETSATRTFSSSLTVAELQVGLAPELALPVAKATPDALLDVLDETRWKFAIINDLHFVGTSPDHINNLLARRALQQVVATAPELVIVAGDLIDEAVPEEFAFAKQQLAAIWGEAPAFPVYYLPGNHELLPQTSGTIENYLAAGFATRGAFDYKGVRFILLNTSSARLYTPEFAQLADLKALLDTAAADPAINHVLVVGHHPTEDALPPGNRALVDRSDAAAVETWMADFVRASGKGLVYYAGHAHYANVRRAEGVAYIIAPAAGKVPYAGPADGGFNGWSLFGVQSDAPAANWLRLSVRPLVKAATLRALDAAGAAITALSVGETVRIDAIGTQHERELAIPLRYPAVPEWAASGNVLVRRFDGENAGAVADSVVAQFDPVRAEVRGLRPGTITIGVRADGRSLAEAELTVLEAPGAS